MDLYIVEDDPAIHAMLRLLVPREAQIRSFLAPTAFLEALDELAPGIVLLDLGLPEMDGHSVHERIVERDRDMAVVFLTGSGAAADAVHAMHRGAADYVCKPFRRAELAKALERANERLQELIEARSRRVRNERLACLTDREVQVLQALAAGKPSKIIAHELGISVRTVEMHRANICSKLRTNTAGAMLLAFEAGWISAVA